MGRHSVSHPDRVLTTMTKKELKDVPMFIEFSPYFHSLCPPYIPVNGPVEGIGEIPLVERLNIYPMRLRTCSGCCCCHYIVDSAPSEDAVKVSGYLLEVPGPERVSMGTTKPKLRIDGISGRYLRSPVRL